MILNAKKILNLSVETQSGEKLGKIMDFDVDVNSHIIKSYSIESGFLGSKKLLISRTQVLSIDEQKMVVEDGTIKESVKQEKKELIQSKTVEPALNTIIVENND